METLTIAEKNLLENCLKNEEQFLFFLNLLKRMNIVIKKPSLEINKEEDQLKKIEEIKITVENCSFVKIFDYIEEENNKKELESFFSKNALEQINLLKTNGFFAFKKTILDSVDFEEDQLKKLEQIYVFFASKEFIAKNVNKPTGFGDKFLYLTVPENYQNTVSIEQHRENTKRTLDELFLRKEITLEQLDILFLKITIDQNSPKDILNFLNTLNG